MCGIVGAVAARDVVPILVAGLERLEYRGYDSSGVAVIGGDAALHRLRAVGKVSALKEALAKDPCAGGLGVAHTRWATHGAPSQRNAHPHICRSRVALVHNGIIENHEALRTRQRAEGFEFTSDTDTEVIVHEVYKHLETGGDLIGAVRAALGDLQGAYAIGVIATDEPGRLVAARNGSPLVVGLGAGETYIASDVAALLPFTNRYLVLEDGDIADIARGGVVVYDRDAGVVERPVHVSRLTAASVERGEYRHFMQKEIFEQPRAVSDTLESRLTGERLLEESFGPAARAVFDATRAVQIIACGTSHHAAMVAKYWMEAVGIPCAVEIASEFVARRHAVPADSLVVTVSQSGETKDTIAALEYARRIGFGRSLAICNAPESSLVRASDLAFMTHAGPEISVASTKAFTTQLVSLLLLTIALARRHGVAPELEAKVVRQLRRLPAKMDNVLKLDAHIGRLAEGFADKRHALFLGRGAHYPIALEGALKLKEISYIHAEAYPAGELKHGPLALVDSEMPVIAVAPNNELLEKLKSNIEEVRSRGGRLLVFADRDAGIEPGEGVEVVSVAPVDEAVSPIIYTLPLQLLAYHVAVIKGTDVDQPRNLAKSVTVV
jgi:glucosamine--fructose-6-phosphate aminotransferase (isomerizing)